MRHEKSFIFMKNLRFLSFCVTQMLLFEFYIKKHKIKQNFHELQITQRELSLFQNSLYSRQQQWSTDPRCITRSPRPITQVMGQFFRVS